MSDDCRCECVWSHEMAMRRLLSIIRQSQSQCSDTECVLPNDFENQTNTEEGNFTMMTMFMVLAAILYFVRPDSIIRSISSTKKHERRSPGGRDPPSDDESPAVN